MSSATGDPSTGGTAPATIEPDWNEGILVPRSERGFRTQERLLEAASEIFVRDGFLDAKITDITTLAKMSSGSFYTYFDSKEAIFTAVIKKVNEGLYVAASVPTGSSRDPLERFELVTRAYVRAYQENAGLLAILEQVATISPRFREMRRNIRQIFRNRSEKGIRRLQGEGRVDPTLSPRCVAEAITSMVSNFCYVWLVLGEDYEEEEVIQTLTTLWASGIGLTPAVES
ncbi:TetR/AcrR family transcriptional regulator [Umezawaea sp. Da 62-37]|uniref:TetR/AcrR family transcriptional regulator n=1 Tax=Umezawaea sp. Da 62-37 TaxID=3075927 RepID=UPI0028F70B54|nr:TetR/AcrR family transcriptional regulator [Umezawaea sp. Da 62-37]WNV88241.1 TetR/AcrR family transcriptional regulator [Umezawaea sp. Da 62-37]